MNHARTRGRRLAAAAVTIVLAATGGTLTTLPATAAPAPAPASATDEPPQTATVRFPLNAEIVSAGTTGFLSRTNVTGTATPEYRWTRYVDGTSTVLPGAALVTGGVSDVVVTGDKAEPDDNRIVKIHDMTAPGAAVEVDLDRLGARYHFAGAIGSTLVVMVSQEDGPRQPHLVTVDGGSLTDRPVTGMPGAVCDLLVTAYAPGTALFDCGSGMGEASSRVVVDLATASAVSTHMGDPVSWDGAVSGTHVAWKEYEGAKEWIRVARRGASESKRFEVTGAYDDTFHLLGGWLTHGERRRVEEGGSTYHGVDPQSPWPMTARSVDTGEKIELLAHLSSAVPAPDGSLMVRGGTLDRGEGLYRVSLGEGGKPVAELVAPTGQATAVTLRGTTVPSVITGARLAKGIDLTWDLSRGDVYAWVTLRHVRTGETEQWSLVKGDGSTAPRTVGLRWNGWELSSSSYHPVSPALSGEYTWEVYAMPDEGIGPTLKATGRFTVTRPPALHDYDGNGTPDLLYRAAGGDLMRIGTDGSVTGGGLKAPDGGRIGPGWQIYDRLESVGNVAGTNGTPDVIARDKSGVLWLYQGTGARDKPLMGRTRIGAGWQAYDQLAGGSDLTGDGRADLVATGRTGELYLYKGTGNATAPFAARTKIGVGWGIYNQLTAVGNIAGGPAGDLVARDRAGVLWLYLGKGDGTFAARTKIGGGWSVYKDLVGIGDGNGDGRPDLLALTSSGTPSYLYAGTGDWKAPLKARATAHLVQPDYWYESGF
ncbi:FG-GAP repeat domain-containing protein [Streptomyces sp. NPDC004284]|uniref:FG-GAP repeat domain-containing protein n=1 Tax=Streptomyces sp. NPDC004284 TaxID=3364695 RepID=UPI0036B1F253